MPSLSLVDLRKGEVGGERGLEAAFRSCAAAVCPLEGEKRKRKTTTNKQMPERIVHGLDRRRALDSDMVSETAVSALLSQVWCGAGIQIAGVESMDVAAAARCSLRK